MKPVPVAQLGADGVVRFVDRAHFLEALSTQLRRRRVRARSARPFTTGTTLGLEIEAPGVAARVSAHARVLFARSDYTTFEILDFDQSVGPALDALERALQKQQEQQGLEPPETPEAPEESEAPARRPIPPRSDTVLDDLYAHGAAEIHFNDEEGGQTEIPAVHTIAELVSFGGLDESSQPGPRPLNEITLVHLPQLEPGAIVRFKGLVDLVGRYFAEIRHGHLSLALDPETEISTDRTELHLFVGPVEARVVARLETSDVLAIAHIQDPSPIEALLRRTFDAWHATILDWALPSSPNASAPAPKSAPVKTPTQPTESARSTIAPPPQAPQENSPSTDTRHAAPRQPSIPPELRESVVFFPSPTALEAELQRNLLNGGLFVASPPLPLRSQHRLQLSVGGTLLPFVLSSDVVFAQNGRVGFALSNPSQAVAQVRTYLAAPGPRGHVAPSVETSSAPIQGAGLEESASASPPSSVDLEPMVIQGTEQGLDPQVPTFSGRLRAPLTLKHLLDFRSHRISASTLPVDEASCLALIDLIVAQGWKGVLTLEAPQSESAPNTTDRGAPKNYTIWFHAGSIAFVDTQPYDEVTSLGRLLLTTKRISESVLREGLETSQARRISLGRALIALGRIKKSDLSVILREQARMKADLAMRWPEGSFRFEPWREPPGNADLILTKGLGVLARHVRHRYLEVELSEIERLLGPNLARTIKPVPDFDQLASTLLLLPKELRFVELQLHQDRPMSEAVLGSPIGRLASLRMIAMGLTLGFLHFEDGERSRVLREVTNVLRETTVIRKLSRSVQERLSTLEALNHFEVLGVHWSAHQRTYRAAHRRALREFDIKEAAWQEASEDVLNMIQKIHGRINEAYTFLSNTENRIDYRQNLFDKSERAFAADMLVKKGEIALMRGDRVFAIECLETAHELAPSPQKQELLETARRAPMA
ncbi:MAG: hypothetical protein H6729_06615 [Deltaproteobacteria bacterium]|nr:hypothetical protein [Deltaproteobacteria bacterium]